MRTALAHQFHNREKWVTRANKRRDWAERRAPRFSGTSDPLADLQRAIDASRSILDLPDDWDDDGSPAISRETWFKTVNFLKEHARLLLTRQGIVIPTPRILPGPDGSMDLHWRTENRELLLNVPAGDELASFYGDDYSGTSIKGHLDVRASKLGLFTWLTVMD